MSSLNADFQEVELGAYGAPTVKKVQVFGTARAIGRLNRKPSDAERRKKGRLAAEGTNGTVLGKEAEMKAAEEKRREALKAKQANLEFLKNPETGRDWLRFSELDSPGASCLNCRSIKFFEQMINTPKLGPPVSGLLN